MQYTYTYIHTYTHTHMHIHIYTYNTNICTLAIFKPHEDTQIDGIFVGRSWWRRGVIESFPNLVLGSNQWDGMECF